MILKLKIPSEIINESKTYNLKSQKLDEAPYKVLGKASEPLPWETWCSEKYHHFLISYLSFYQPTS